MSENRNSLGWLILVGVVPACGSGAATMTYRTAYPMDLVEDAGLANAPCQDACTQLAAISALEEEAALIAGDCSFVEDTPAVCRTVIGEGNYEECQVEPGESFEGEPNEGGGFDAGPGVACAPGAIWQLPFGTSIADYHGNCSALCFGMVLDAGTPSPFDPHVYACSMVGNSDYWALVDGGASGRWVDDINDGGGPALSCTSGQNPVTDVSIRQQQQWDN